MSVPNSRNWKAVEEPNSEGGGYRVRVTGEVEAESPSLHPRVPQGLDPRILMLDLSKVDDGSDYQEVEFRQPSELHAYDQVDIFFLGQEVSRVVVDHTNAVASEDVEGRKNRTKRRRKKATRKKAAKKKVVRKNTAKKKTKNIAKKKTKKSKRKSGKKASRKKRS